MKLKSFVYAITSEATPSLDHAGVDPSGICTVIPNLSKQRNCAHSFLYALLNAIMLRAIARRAANRFGMHDKPLWR